MIASHRALAGVAVTVVFAATLLLIFGGPALHYFALALTIGILFGIYSSVLVASPLVMWLGAKREQFIVPTKRKGGPRDEHEGAVV